MNERDQLSGVCRTKINQGFKNKKFTAKISKNNLCMQHKQTDFHFQIFINVLSIFVLFHKRFSHANITIKFNGVQVHKCRQISMQNHFDIGEKNQCKTMIM